VSSPVASIAWGAANRDHYSDKGAIGTEDGTDAEAAEPADVPKSGSQSPEAVVNDVEKPDNGPRIFIRLDDEGYHEGVDMTSDEQLERFNEGLPGIGDIVPDEYGMNGDWLDFSDMEIEEHKDDERRHEISPNATPEQPDDVNEDAPGYDGGTTAENNDSLSQTDDTIDTITKENNADNQCGSSNDSETELRLESVDEEGSCDANAVIDSYPQENGDFSNGVDESYTGTPPRIPSIHSPEVSLEETEQQLGLKNPKYFSTCHSVTDEDESRSASVSTGRSGEIISGRKGSELRDMDIWVEEVGLGSPLTPPPPYQAIGTTNLIETAPNFASAIASPVTEVPLATETALLASNSNNSSPMATPTPEPTDDCINIISLAKEAFAISQSGIATISSQPQSQTPTPVPTTLDAATQMQTPILAPTSIDNQPQCQTPITEVTNIDSQHPSQIPVPVATPVVQNPPAFTVPPPVPPDRQPIVWKLPPGWLPPMHYTESMDNNLSRAATSPFKSIPTTTSLSQMHLTPRYRPIETTLAYIRPPNPAISTFQSASRTERSPQHDKTAPSIPADRLRGPNTNPSPSCCRLSVGSILNTAPVGVVTSDYPSPEPCVPEPLSPQPPPHPVNCSPMPMVPTQIRHPLPLSQIPRSSRQMQAFQAAPQPQARQRKSHNPIRFVLSKPSRIQASILNQKTATRRQKRQSREPSYRPGHIWEELRRPPEGEKELSMDRSGNVG
jgi:hypothetical protein